MHSKIPTGTEKNDAPLEQGHSQAAPPAAKIVLESPVEESDAGELVKTKRELAEEKAARKKEQTRMAELEDENRTLKTPPNPPVKKEAEATKKSFLSGARDLLNEII